MFAGPPLAALGTGADRGLPRQAARPVRLHPRPDAAAAEQGPAAEPRSPRTLELPPGLEREWHCRGYYGSLSHNVKAVYQRYLGWFDGNPAHLWPHPAAGGRGALRGARGRRRAAAPERPPGVRGGRLPLGGGARQPPRVRRPRQRRGEGAAGASAGAARLRRRERDLAQLLPDRRRRAARGRRWGAPPRSPRKSSPASPPASCWTRSRSRSTVPAPARRGSRCAGRCRTPARSSCWCSRTACSATARAGPREDQVQAT